MTAGKETAKCFMPLACMAMAVFAILIQVQFTVEIGATPVRINAADVACAIVSPLLLYALYLHAGNLFRFTGPCVSILFACATVAMTISLLIGANAAGGVTNWAASKYAGWYVLVGYFVLACMASLVLCRKAIDTFILVFISFQVIQVPLYGASLLFGWTFVYPLLHRFQGFIGNPNAVGFYLICGLALLLVILRRDHSDSRKWIMTAAAAILVAGVIYTVSASALLALICVLACSWLLRIVTAARLFQILAIAGFIWLGPQSIAPERSVRMNVFEKLIIVLDRDDVSGTAQRIRQFGGNPEIRRRISVAYRLEGYREAYAMWRENPVFGGGLGTHLNGARMAKAPNEFALQIHNTALWILAEMGAFGLISFLGLFGVLCVRIWQNAHATSRGLHQHQDLALVGILVLVGWSVQSLTGELMYQRALWLFLGMAFTAPLYSTANRVSSNLR